jgi:hypothetical protein
MLSFPVLKVLDRTTKVLVDREEKGLGMDMVRKLFWPSCGSGGGVCEPRDNWENSSERRNAMRDPDNRETTNNSVGPSLRPSSQFVPTPNPRNKPPAPPPKRRVWGATIYDGSGENKKYIPYPYRGLVRSFIVTYNNRNGYGTLFDASWSGNCKLAVSEFEQGEGEPHFFMISGKDDDHYISIDNVTNDESWVVGSVCDTVIKFEAVNKLRQTVGKFKFGKVEKSWL